MPKKIEITDFKERHGGLVINVKVNDELDRVFFITNNTISRHADEENMIACIEGRKIFNRDAFIFFGERAETEIWVNLLPAINLTEEQKDKITELIPIN